ERLRRGARLVHGVAFAARLGEQRSEGTLVGCARALPVEAVVPARLAADLLREDVAWIEPRVLQLSGDVGTNGRDHPQHAVTDAAVEQLVLTCGGVEAPLVPVLHEGDGERGAPAAEMRDDRAVGQRLEAGSLRGHGDEAPAFGGVLDGVARLHQRLALRSED